MPKQLLSPLPGTFYRRPAPDKPVYKNEGDKVAVGDVIGLIEVMKVFNSVRGSVKGTIAQVVAQNGQFVEYGQTLFLVKP